jgi:type I restriction enzyme S subunit
MNQMVKITDVCSFQGGTQPPKSVWKKDLVDGYIRMLQIRDFTQPEKNNVEYIPYKKTLKTCESDDILIGRYGASVGKICTGLSGAYNVALIKTIPDKNKISRDYLLHLLKGNSFQNYILNVGSRAAQAGFNKDDLEGFTFSLPPLDQQKKIAAILDAADAYRQKTKVLIEKYDELTQSLFLDMFGDPVTNPKGWDKVALNELCDFKKTSVKPEEIETGYTYIGLECIEKQTGKILERFIVEAGEIKSNKFWFDSNYILYGKLRPYLNKVANPDFEGVCSTDIIPIRPVLKNTAKEFIISLLRGSWFVSFADERCSGANLPRISPKEVEKYQTINPPIKLQNQFAERVQAIEAQKAQAQASLAQAEDLFNSLLQRAFKGELV